MLKVDEGQDPFQLLPRENRGRKVQENETEGLRGIKISSSDHSWMMTEEIPRLKKSRKNITQDRLFTEMRKAYEDRVKRLVSIDPLEALSPDERAVVLWLRRKNKDKADQKIAQLAVDFATGNK